MEISCDTCKKSDSYGFCRGLNELGVKSCVLTREHYAPKESDPNGISQHAPGAKLDSGKLLADDVLQGFALALEAVIKVGTDGAAKYSLNGWKEVEDGIRRYDNANVRHRIKRWKGERYDKSGSLHRAHECWNALASLQMELMEAGNGAKN